MSNTKKPGENTGKQGGIFQEVGILGILGIPGDSGNSWEFWGHRNSGHGILGTQYLTIRLWPRFFLP